MLSACGGDGGGEPHGRDSPSCCCNDDQLLRRRRQQQEAKFRPIELAGGGTRARLPVLQFPRPVPGPQRGLRDHTGGAVDPKANMARCYTSQDSSALLPLLLLPLLPPSTKPGVEGRRP